MNKDSRLLRTIVNYGSKKFYNIGPGCGSWLVLPQCLFSLKFHTNFQFYCNPLPLLWKRALGFICRCNQQDTPHGNRCSVLLFWESRFYCYAECHCAECLYAECHYVECHRAAWIYAECHMLNVIFLIVIGLNVIWLNAVMMSVIQSLSLTLYVKYCYAECAECRHA